MEEEDIRWKQKYVLFIGALYQMKNALQSKSQTAFSKLELQGVIQAFEITQELSWKVMKDFLEAEGKNNLFESKTVYREAFNLGIITNGELWLNTIKSRNKTSYIHNEAEILELFELINNEYLPIFIDFENYMKTYL
jgi:nucleotidyltransferase substrate binding protein (TIGR01987 family)